MYKIIAHSGSRKSRIPSVKRGLKILKGKISRIFGRSKGEGDAMELLNGYQGFSQERLGDDYVVVKNSESGSRDILDLGKIYPLLDKAQEEEKRTATDVKVAQRGLAEAKEKFKELKENLANLKISNWIIFIKNWTSKFSFLDSWLDEIMEEETRIHRDNGFSDCRIPAALWAKEKEAVRNEIGNWLKNEWIEIFIEIVKKDGLVTWIKGGDWSSDRQRTYCCATEKVFQEPIKRWETSDLTPEDQAIVSFIQYQRNLGLRHAMKLAIKHTIESYPKDELQREVDELQREVGELQREVGERWARLCDLEKKQSGVSKKVKELKVEATIAFLTSYKINSWKKFIKNWINEFSCLDSWLNGIMEKNEELVLEGGRIFGIEVSMEVWAKEKEAVRYEIESWIKNGGIEILVEILIKDGLVNWIKRDDKSGALNGVIPGACDKVFRAVKRHRKTEDISPPHHKAIMTMIKHESFIGLMQVLKLAKTHMIESVANRSLTLEKGV